MIAWLMETAIAVTLLMAVVLALRGPVARSFGAGWAYALWAVPALRLVLPPLPQLAPDLSLSSAVNFIPTAAEMTAPLPVEAGPGQWLPFILALWAGGAVIFLTIQWLSYRSFLARVRGSARPGRPPIFGGIRTWVSEAVEGPLALGIIERRIVLPADFSRRYGPIERRLALEHELVHHRRGDIWWNIAAMIVLALFWFNPVAWVAFRAFRIDQELACDAAVARAVSFEERHDYARALIKSASTPGLVAACALNPARQLKRRLRMMRGHRSSPLRSAGGVLALSAFALIGFAVGSAPVHPEAEAVQFVSASLPAPVAPIAQATEAQAAVRPTAAPVSIVVTGRRSRASAPVLASAPAPLIREEDMSVSLSRLLARLPKISVGPHPAPQPRITFARASHPAHPTPRKVYRFEAYNGGERQVYLVREALTVEQAEEVRVAIARAVADVRNARIKMKREIDEAHEEHGFSGLVDIQTIHEGETGR